VACRPHWCTAHVCSTVRDPHPRPLWFRAGAAPPVPRRHTRDGTGGKRARRGPARPHGRGANAPAWCLPGSIHQRMQAVTPAPYHSTSMDGAVPDARHNSSVHCTSASLATSSEAPVLLCAPFFLHELRQFSYVMRRTGGQTAASGHAASRGTGQSRAGLAAPPSPVLLRICEKRRQSMAGPGELTCPWFPAHACIPSLTVPCTASTKATNWSANGWTAARRSGHPPTPSGDRRCVLCCAASA
jgi:hypothetical protein